MDDSSEVNDVGLKARELATLDKAWASDLRGESEAAQGDWISAADALREGSADDKTRARLVYWALRENLDPTAAQDVARILYILRSGLERRLLPAPGRRRSIPGRCSASAESARRGATRGRARGRPAASDRPSVH